MTRKSPKLAVDAAILKNDSIILIKRKYDPYRGKWALPGGFVEYRERVEDALIREAKEETGLDVRIERIIGVYSDPNRDPRGHTVSVCFLCEIAGGDLNADTDASEAREFKLSKLPRLAFDHGRILEDVVDLLKKTKD